MKLTNSTLWAIVATLLLFAALIFYQKENYTINELIRNKMMEVDSLQRERQKMEAEIRDLVENIEPDTFIIENNTIRYYEKRNAIITLSADSTVSRLATWLSSADSLR